MFGDKRGEEKECLDDLKIDMMVESRFNHSYLIERAIQIAMLKTGFSRTMIVTASLLGRFNLCDYISGMKQEDVDWIHAMESRAIKVRDEKIALVKSADETEALARKMIESANAVRRGVV